MKLLGIPIAMAGLAVALLNAAPVAQVPTPDRGSSTSGAWSATVNGVRGRLWATAVATADRPQLQLDLELENVRDRIDPIAIWWGTLDGNVLKLSLEDESGTALPQATPGGNYFSIPPFWLQIPVHSAIRITISKAAYEYIADGRVLLRPFTFVAWEIPVSRTAPYYLRATLAPRPSTDPASRPWLGPLELPRVVILQARGSR